MRTRKLIILIAICLSMAFTAAHAATIISGTLYFTTFQNQGGTVLPLTKNFWSIDFMYDGTKLCLGSTIPTCPATVTPVPIAALKGADGIVYDRNDPNYVLIGEQSANAIARIKIDGSGLVEMAANGLNPIGSPPLDYGQAYDVEVTPDGASVISVPNDLGKTGEHSITVSPLKPFGPGVMHTITGDDNTLRGLAFMGNTAYYGDADDRLLGHFGQLNLSTFVTTRSIIVDDTGGGAGQGGLPTHSVELDTFSSCFIVSGGDLIWQLCPDAFVVNKFHIKAKVATNDYLCHSSGQATADCGFDNWDTVTVDGLGHLFAANNNGDVYFIDYSKSATKSIDDPLNYKDVQFLKEGLDDFVNGGGGGSTQGGGGGTGCPATQGFWHKAANWPRVHAVVDGIIYNGDTDFSMVIGGKTYTQAQLLQILPGGGLHSGNYANGLSEMIAAVLNEAAGAKLVPTADSAISLDNAALSTINIFNGNVLTIVPAVSSVIQGNLSVLDNYNSAVGMNCTEGSGLITGKSK